MKGKLKNLRNLTTTYELFIGVGLLMVIATSIKLFGVVELSSDWFWFIAGLALVVEGVMLLRKQRQFDKKYKVVPREHS